MKSKMFFQPRIGQHYQEGFRGYRTLVLGVKHHCTLRHCRYYSDCVNNRNCASYDAQCLAYDCSNYVNGRKMCEDCISLNGKHCCYFEQRTMEEKHDSFLLSQSNIIEINAFLEENDHYPAYTYFTKLVLNKSDDLSDDEKTDFWEHAAFYNYLQYFCDSPQVPDYEEDGLIYRQEDWEAFQELMVKLDPEVIFVWNSALKVLLDKKIKEGVIPGLTHFDDFQSETLTVNRYLYKVQPKKTPKEWFDDFRLTFCCQSDEATAVRLMLNALQKARFRQFVLTEDLKLTSEMVEATQSSIWDKELLSYLIGKLPAKQELDKLVGVFESDLKELAIEFRCASSFPWEVADTKAIDVGGELSELSWFDLGKTGTLDDASIAILYLTDTSDALKMCLKALGDNKLDRVVLLLNVKDSHKLLLDVTSCSRLYSIEEKEQALLIQFDDKKHTRVSLKYGGFKSVYRSHSSLKQSRSLRPSHFMSVMLEEKPDFQKLIEKVFGNSMIKIDKLDEEYRYLDLILSKLWDKKYIIRSDKERLKTKKVPQLFYYCLNKAGIEYKKLKQLFDYPDMEKNTTPKKIEDILKRDSEEVKYYKKIFKQIIKSVRND